MDAVLELAAESLADLPQPIALHLDVAGSPLPVVFVTCSLSTHASTAIVFDRDELRALVLGVEADRIWHREFLGFCFEKWRDSSFRLSEEIALAGANPDEARWSTSRMLSRLQARITDVEWLDSRASEFGADHAKPHAASPALWAAA
jgi:hypothetical protein